jgi:NAD(P)-dependent dehydrogenase (short-subunit alcohol dehydrogenase family)
MALGFEGRVALVTGGNAGIGKATALLFAAKGAKVAIAARREAEGEKTVAEIRAEGGDAAFFQVDVRSGHEVEALVGAVLDRYGRLDHAFNNAGVAAGGSIHELTEDTWDRVLDINLKGVWLSMKHELPPMIEQGFGTIVNNASMLGLAGSAGSAPYTASKHGVVGLTKCAAMEYGRKGIRVNSICVGLVETDMTHGMIRGIRERDAEASINPLERIGEPSEVAEAVVWLSSDSASFINAEAMRIDGGALARGG